VVVIDLEAALMDRLLVKPTERDLEMPEPIDDFTDRRL
jgi:hypothetical protein